MSFLSTISSFGSSLISNINGQLNLNENNLSTFDYGLLGDFANKIDQTAQRQYTEDGFLRDIRPRSLEILMQQPEITVLVKKQMFSSLIENFRYDLMDQTERLLILASKRLFQNKCNAIAAYELLSKTEKIVEKQGYLSDVMMPIVFAGVDSADAAGLNLLDSQTRGVLETLRKIYSFSNPNYTTTWLQDKQFALQSNFGVGTGVIELTNMASVNTTTSVKFGGGSASISIEDPYKLTVITSQDLEQAIQEALNFTNTPSFFNISENALNQVTQDLKNSLQQSRRARGADQIIFKINPNSILQHKIRIYFDTEGRELHFSYDPGVFGIGASVQLDQSVFQGKNNLTTQEADFLSQIIQNTYQLLSFQTGQKTFIQTNTKKVNYLRERMNLFYAGRSIIQDMDQVHIYISSQTTLDQKVSMSLATKFGTGNQLLSKLDSTYADVQDSVDAISDLFGGSSGSAFEQKKNAIMGQDFPLWLYKLLRNNLTKNSSGPHVFAGVVTKTPQNYSSGKYSLNINVSDNCEYFRMGQININPSLDVFNGAVYDPLTPFDLKFDASSGFLQDEFPPLLEENIQLINSGVAKFQSGKYLGQTVTPDKYQEGTGENTLKNLRKILHDPNGFVYRFKRGIGSITLFNDPAPSYSIPETSPKITSNPFAGQDVMNVLSLLVTGQPYNFNSFARAALAVGSLTNDDLFNKSGSNSFFRGLLSDLNKKNATWGNFIPFKKMSINESAYNFLRTGELDLLNSQTKINSLLQERAKLFDELTIYAPDFANNPQFYSGQVNLDTAGLDLAIVSTKTEKIIQLDFQIEQAKNEFNNGLSNPNLNIQDGQIKIFGDDITYDSSVVNTNDLNQGNKIRKRQDFRKKLNTLTQRSVWKVRANEDPNLFIVDDSYDKNYDIQAFEKSLSGNMSLFNSTYSDVFSQISQTASILGLEIFADTQGHIQVRPPQYNRFPSSVYYQLLQDRNKNGKQIFPEFLEQLFINQIQGLSDQIEIVEDQIRLKSAALGYIDDQAIKTFLAGSTNFSSSFSFVTEEITGKLGGKDYRLLIKEANSDLKQEEKNNTLNELKSIINSNLSSNVNFDIIRRVELANEQNFLLNNVDTNQINTRINIIAQRLERKINQKISKNIKDIIGNARAPDVGLGQVDFINVTNEIATSLSERQSLITTLANSIKNLSQGLVINDTDSLAAQTPLYPHLITDQEFPEILEHMIEDESYDDLGLGSGSRYVIKDYQIISYDITPELPPFTSVEVTGLFGEGLVDGPNDLQIGQGGNAVSTAIAVDYDMMRMYGFRSQDTVKAPFLSDPEGQCAPYAVFLLNLARKNILQGSITLIGNEYYQPGEVVYLEDRDLLFYVESVSHSFSYGSNFTTTLSLTYGHVPGEYIPTMLDIIGKGLYTKRHQANLIRHERFEREGDDVPLTTIIVEQNENQNNLEALISSRFGEQNRKSLSNLLVAISGAFNGNRVDVKPILELRIYGNPIINQSLVQIGEEVKNWILDPRQQSLAADKSLLPDPLPSGFFKISSDDVQVRQVNLTDINDIRSPSTKAWNISRTLNPQYSSDQSLDILINNIIDVWLIFESITQSLENTTKVAPENTPSQYSQEKLQAAIDAFNSKLAQQ